MYLKLSKIEIAALKELCRGDLSAGKLAEKLGAKPSFISRVLKSLLDKGLVLVEKQATSRIASLSPASHAQAFKKLSDSRPNARIEEWLSGGAMDILAVACEGVEIPVLLEETGCSEATLYKCLKLLASVGAISRRMGRVEARDRLVREFGIAYADNMQLLAQKGVNGLNFSIRVRKNVILRTSATNVPLYCSKTGISLLAENGLEALLTSYNDFYFNLDRSRRNICVEEAFAHALLITTMQQRQDMTVLGIFFAKNRRRLNFVALKSFAKKYGVEAALDEMRGKAEFHEKMRQFE